jgi:hypothetical protein
MARILQWGIPVCIRVADQKVLVSNLNFVGRVGNAGIRTPELFSQLPSQATFLAKSQITLTFLNDFTGHDLPPKAPSITARVCGFGFHILRRWFEQARRARSPQIAQALDVL